MSGEMRLESRAEMGKYSGHLVPASCKVMMLFESAPVEKISCPTDLIFLSAPGSLEAKPLVDRLCGTAGHRRGLGEVLPHAQEPPSLLPLGPRWLPETDQAHTL